MIQWPGGVNMQLYWHTTKPSYAAFGPSPKQGLFLGGPTPSQTSSGFARQVVSDDVRRGVEIGRPKDSTAHPY